MKILNLFAGIGGNRTLWGDKHDITAVENNQKVALIYKKRFPMDQVYIMDAYNYCLWNFDKYDFIWASPPCPTHSVCNNFLHVQGTRRYPDMGLWQLIIYLEKFCQYNKNNIKYCVENVIPYYDPLIKPAFQINRHYFWANFYAKSKGKRNSEITVTNARSSTRRDNWEYLNELENELGIKIREFEGVDHRKLLRNCVNPKTGKYILDCLIKPKQTTLF